MITLRPPFRAENMEGLYNKVIKGQYSKIPEKFSSDLMELVKYLLQVQPENRPTPDQILKNPIVQKRMEFFKTYSDDMHHDANLLQTIRIPKNLLFLTDRLPQANYEKAGKKKEFYNNSVDVNLKKKKALESQTKDTKDYNSNLEVSKELKEVKPISNSTIDDEDKLKNDLKEDAGQGIDGQRGNKQPKEKKETDSKENADKTKIKSQREKDDRNKKVIAQNLYQPNSGSQEILPSINREGNNYAYNENKQ